MDFGQFPTRPDCFGEPGCNNTVSWPMYQFLNMTADNYNSFYCLNPPGDSCAFGYCPNPDVASPAVRAATYISEVGLSILILHSPSDLLSSFYAQILAVYSLLISVIVAIGFTQITRLHAVFALVAAGSPLSIYLVISALRASWNDFNHWRLTRRYRRLGLSWPVREAHSGGANHEGDVDAHEERIKRHRTRLDSIFGPGQRLNKALVLFLVPIWFTVFICVSLPKDSPVWFGIFGNTRQNTFSQSACDATVGGHLTESFFYGPLLLIINQPVWMIAIVISSFGVLVFSWILCILLQRQKIWKAGMNVGRLPFGRLWTITTAEYPFIYHLTVVTYPSALWIVALEDGLRSVNEHFAPTYGQLLAIFVAVPPFIQCFMLLPRGWRWIKSLSWARWIGNGFSTKKKNSPQENVERQDSGMKEARGSFENVRLMPFKSRTLSGSETYPITLGHNREDSLATLAG